MAIQFHCPSCSQPIEVDDVHAGQAATCPYCHRVVSVPTESSLGPVPPVSARPTATPAVADPPPEPDDGQTPTPPTPRPLPGELPVRPTIPAREQTGRALGSYALICTALSVLLFGGVTVYILSQLAPELWKNPGSQPSQEQLTQLTGSAWLGAAQIGGMFFALVGLVMGITSLVQGRTGNWRAIVSVVTCGLLLLCVCGGGLLAGAAGLGVGA